MAATRTVFPRTPASGDLFERLGRAGQRADAGHVGPQAGPYELVQPAITVGDGCPGMPGQSAHLEPADDDPLEQDQVKRYAGDGAGGEADADKPSAPGQRAQRGLGVAAADRVDDDICAPAVG